MSESIHPPALARDDDPSPCLAAHYEHLWATRRHDLPGTNPALAVEVAWFRRVSGDWLGAVVTPWFVRLFLFNGGGALWGDIPAGERRYVSLPCGMLLFVATVDPEIGSYQYSALVAEVRSLPDMAVARQVAADALAMIVPPAADDPRPAQETVSRRGFLRKLAGRR